jgi:hypothetical protein
MDTAELRQAYDTLLDEIEAGGFGPPPDGEWSAAQVVAHVVANDELLIVATRAVLAGAARPYYNHDAIDAARLDELGTDLPTLAGRLRESSATLCGLVEEMDEVAAATPVHMEIRDGDRTALDAPVPWGRAVGIQARAHLPNHTAQLRALRPAPTT